jgi:hypothetical protein
MSSITRTPPAGADAYARSLTGLNPQEHRAAMEKKYGVRGDGGAESASSSTGSSKSAPPGAEELESKLKEKGYTDDQIKTKMEAIFGPKGGSSSSGAASDSFDSGSSTKAASSTGTKSQADLLEALLKELGYSDTEIKAFLKKAKGMDKGEGATSTDTSTANASSTSAAVQSYGGVSGFQEST